VRVVFSPDEIEMYVAVGSVDKDAKVKIHNAFAGLTMLGQVENSAIGKSKVKT